MVHSLTAKMSYPDIIGNTPVEEIKKLYHKWRNEAKGIEFAINKITYFFINKLLKACIVQIFIVPLQ